MSTNQNSPIRQMPPDLTPEQVAKLSQKELGDRIDQIMMSNSDQLRANHDQFLKDHPQLDFRNKK